MFGKKKELDLSRFGYSIVSKNVIDGKGKIKWCIREEPINEFDNGWRFLSDVDTDEFLSDSNNMMIISWKDLMDFESFLITIFQMPIGTDMYMEIVDGKKHFFDTETDRQLL